MPATDTRAAVLNALRIAGVDPTGRSHTAIPSATARATVDRLCDTTPDRLRDERVDIKELMRGLLDWSGPRATKAVNRTALAAMTADRDDGASLWPHAVEAIAYIAIWAPLLDPDRLDRVLSHACENPTSAYAPIRYTATPAAKLQRLVGHYQPQRLEMLAISLWDAAHSGRWWDTTAGLGATGDGTRTLRRRRTKGQDRAAAIEARNAAVEASLNATSASVVSGVLDGSQTHWSPHIVECLREVRIDGVVLGLLEEFVTEDHDDPDVNILLAQLVDLPPVSRPASPFIPMIDALEFLLDEAVYREVLPKKPESWKSLYPLASLQPYPLDPVVDSWDLAHLPGAGKAVVELIRSPHALFENRDYMGNCTGGYNSRCLDGTWVLGKVHLNGDMYNWSITRTAPRGWRLSEVNSRFNRGSVPDPIRSGLQEMVERISRGLGPA